MGRLKKIVPYKATVISYTSSCTLLKIWLCILKDCNAECEKGFSVMPDAEGKTVV